ncbi:coiled-coil domain-containing protein 93 [Trifolium pratense]|uniref:coiled-coil domain-containing protein 93 n=1 Tax=Trifolium pratense TaxID=57577 RepID=UPI001E692348|nr:coiled-coil domain-containing protein 93 [Trifolium pratense]
MENTFDKISTVNQILDLLSVLGYVDTTNSDAPPHQKITDGLSWIIATLNPNIIHDQNNTNWIEESLKLLECPHSLQQTHIQDLDIDALLPVIQWLTSRFNEVYHHENTIEFEQEDQLKTTSINDNLDELNHRKMNVVEKLDELRSRIDKEGADSAVQKLYTLMKSLKDLERKENHFLVDRDSKHSELQSEIDELERKLENECDSKSLTDGLQHSFSESLERVDLMKKELAARLRDVVAVRRQIDDLLCQSEIVQYEHRLSELYAQIQGKHRQTRKYYSTYNALLEIKELMLKETSLLNSIISQFQEAFSSTDGRTKLVHSMEGIVKGSQQKLEKVQLGLQQEERNRNDLKDRYAAAIGEQKRCYSLMKAFQEKCTKERLHYGV